VFQISYFGIGPTEIRLGLLAYAIGLIALGAITIATPIGPVSPLDALAVIIFAVVFVSYLCMTWTAARELAALDRPAETSRAITAASVSHEQPLSDTPAPLPAMSR
jgi:hypothetical protein